MRVLLALAVGLIAMFEALVMAMFGAMMVNYKLLVLALVVGGIGAAVLIGAGAWLLYLEPKRGMPE